jgi:alanine racemase
MAKSSSPDLRPLKRSSSEKDSAFNYLLTAAKKVRSETHASHAETSDTTDDSGSAKQRGEALEGLSEQIHNEQFHLTKYIGVRWSTKKAKWR